MKKYMEDRKCCLGKLFGTAYRLQQKEKEKLANQDKFLRGGISRI